MRPTFLLFLILCLTGSAFAQKLAVVDGVTFIDEPGVLYLPAREVGKALDWNLYKGPDGKTIYLNRKRVEQRVRKLPDGTALVPLTEFKRRGLSVTSERSGRAYKVRIKKRAFLAREGLKRVVVNKTHLQVRGWQGQHVVMAAPVTLGIEGKETPSGIFRADGIREKMHKSKLYKDAPMPWSVHIVGNVYVHGWPKVTSRRGSHGCIRLPLNDARFFYYWAEKGTPVSILGKWPRGAKARA